MAHSDRYLTRSNDKNIKIIFLRCEANNYKMREKYEYQLKRSNYQTKVAATRDQITVSYVVVYVHQLRTPLVRKRGVY